MNITLLVLTDGRGDCLARTLESFRAQVHGPITRRVLIDDSADPHYAAWLDAQLSDEFELAHHATRRGFGGAIQSGWDRLSPCDFIFHLEDDFVFNRTVELAALAQVLRHQPGLAQMALRRQAVNAAEIAAGGVVELRPTAYRACLWQSYRWLEHQLFFTTNPSLYPWPITRFGWPQIAHSEGHFTEQLRARGFRFGYWGLRTDAPWVEHIGQQRIGTGY